MIVVYGDKFLKTGFLSTFLNQEFNTKVESCVNENELFKMLNKGLEKALAVVLCSRKVEVSKKVQHFLYQNNIKLITEPDCVTALKDEVQGLGLESNSQNYFYIPLYEFLDNAVFPFDLYLKLGDKKVIRYLNSGDPLMLKNENIKNLKEKKALCIRNIDLEGFFYYMDSKFDEFFDSDSEDHLLETTKAYLEIISEKLKVLGMNEADIQLCIFTVETTLKGLLENDNTKSIIEKILLSSSFYPDHCLGIAVVANIILKNTTWNIGDNKDKLIQAALFHDIVLADKELALVDIMPMHEHNRATQLKLIDHISEPKFPKFFETFPADVIRVIKEHHTRPGQEGYPSGGDCSKLLSLSIVFIVAEEFYVNSTITKDLDELVGLIRDRLDAPVFQKSINALEYCLGQE